MLTKKEKKTLGIGVKIACYMNHLWLYGSNIIFMYYLSLFVSNMEHYNGSKVVTVFGEQFYEKLIA